MNMIKQAGIIGSIFGFLMLASHANACMEHYMYGQQNGGFFGGSNSGFNAMRPVKKEKVFKVKHPQAAVAFIDQDTSFNINYELPASSKNVSIQFTTNNKVEMLDQDIQLTDLDGTVTARFRAKQKGLDVITVTVSGEHDGEVLEYSSRLYVSAKEPTAS